MERIKQAIEKAKKDRPGRVRQLAHSNLDRNAYSQSRTSQAHDELGDFSYEHTRVVKLDVEHLERNRIVAFDKNNPRGIHFDLLRTHVIQKMDEMDWRTLAIISPTPEAGKTMVAINLAMSIAQKTDKTAMLVDFDLRRPKIGEYLGVPMEKSLNDLLAGTTELADILINPDMPRLVVLATKKAVVKASETLSSKRISDLIKDLRERYESRIVIFDLPPVLVTDDAIALLPQIDCVLMVVANGMSTKRQIEDSVRLVPEGRLLGTVLNKAQIEQNSYYYY